MNQDGGRFDENEALFESSYGLLIIREYKGALALHFDWNEVQSAMLKDAPDDLLLSYTRVMMNFLRFNGHPHHIGMIGLGGGSLQKHCYRHLPRTVISVAEINPGVIALRNRFLIPEDDERFTVHCEDGADFVRRHKGCFDVLVVDGFDHKGQPPQLCSPQFYNHCYRSLTSRGILVVNICDRHDLIPQIRSRFRDQVMISNGGYNSSNTIVFAGKGNILAKSKWSVKTESKTPTPPAKQWEMIA